MFDDQTNQQKTHIQTS